MLPEPIKARIVRKIKDIASPIRVILFGSYAYGSPKPGSDIDIVVILEKSVSKIRDSDMISRALRDIRIPKDIIVATQEEYDFYRKEPGSVFRTVAEKGVTIYG